MRNVVRSVAVRLDTMHTFIRGTGGKADLFVSDAYDFVDLPKSPFPEWLPALVFASQSCGWEHLVFGESRVSEYEQGIEKR